MPAQTSSTPILPSVLESAGYDTYAGCAFVTPFLAIRSWYQNHRVYADEKAERVLADYRKWRGDRDRSFGYLHLGDLHAPLAPPEKYIDIHNVDMSLPDLRRIRRYRTDFDPSDSECQYYRDNKHRLYQAALDYLTDQLSSFIEVYQDDTMIFIVGDHGEAFWEHQDIDRQITDSRPNYCYGHGGTPFDVVSRVPVASSLPDGSSPLPEGGWGSVRDLATTITELTVEGVSPNGLSWMTPIPDDRAVVCEGVRYGVERKAVYQYDTKLIRSTEDDVTLTAKITDTGEMFEDLSEETVSELMSHLPRDEKDKNLDTDSSAYLQEQLKALGYK